MTAADSPANEPSERGASVPSLYVTGTEPVHWGDWVDCLWPDRYVQPVDARNLTATDSSGPFLTFIESPVRCLALALGDGGDVNSTLAAWEASARGLLRRLHRDPANFAVVDLQEAMQTPEGLARALQPVLPGHPASRPAAAPRVDPVWMALSERIIAERPELSALAEELAVSCIVLDGAQAQTDGLAPLAVAAYRDVLGHAAEVHARLGEAQDSLAQHEARQRELNAELHDQAAALQTLTVTKQSELSALREECARLDMAARKQFELALTQANRLREKVDEDGAKDESNLRDFRELGERLSGAQNLAEECRREADLHLIRLHEAQAEVTRLSALVDQVAQDLAAEREGRKADAAARATLAEQLAASELQCRVLMTEWAATQQAKARSDRTDATLRASIQRTESLSVSLRRERDALALELKETRAQGDLLLTQLHVQQAYLAGAKEEALPRTRVNAVGVVAIGGLQLIGVSEEGTHRHVDLLLQDLTLGESTLDEMPLRLVEHHGHPGLVLFRSSGHAPLLSAWTSTGSENGREHLLLVPEDQSARAFILGLGSTDWSRLNGMVEMVQRLLAGNESLAARGWARSASRLIHVLDALPARVRYDGIRAAAQVGRPTTLVLVDASFGRHRLGDATLVVTLDADSLEWRLPDNPCTVPCVAWPVSERGEALATWHLPVGAAVASDAKRHAWAGLNPSARELLLGMLDALCSDAVVAPQATQWRDEARRILASIRKADLARRLLRRIAKP